MVALHPYLQSALGGLMIGLASWWLLASLGRIAGISGITAALLPARQPAPERAWQAAFLAGLVLGGALCARWLHIPDTPLRPLPLLLIAGFLVGLGTVMGSGCTSGHGVCGLGRRSVRSLAATATFMGAGMATVALQKLLQN
ncbi:MAG: YeeE/YedE family protein [Curvibacter sp.]|nr:MAG: YeeE/YedE family protein [Curvibacter sp.]